MMHPHGPSHLKKRRSTRLAGSDRERAIAPNAAKSSALIANSIACRHAAMTSTPAPNQSRKATSHVRKNESCPYDRFQGIDELVSVAKAQMVRWNRDF
jgi:hypothetical protein